MTSKNRIRSIGNDDLMSLGNTLHDARRRMKLTTSEVAEATRMKVQMVEDIEKEDFSRVAAPIYGKGFIRLYAEHVKLDPKPLIDEYVTRFLEGTTPPPLGHDPPPVVLTGTPPSEPEEADEQEHAEEELELFEADEVSPGEQKRSGRKREKEADRRRSWKEAVLNVPGVLGAIGQALVKTWRDATVSLKEKQQRFVLPRINFNDMPLRSVSVILGVLIILVCVISGLRRCVRQATKPTALTEELQVAIDLPAPYFD